MPKRIFVIDDEEGVLEGLKSWLEDEGFEVEAAQRAVEGLERITQAPPDLVILDIIMPEMDGFEVLEEMKKNHRTASIPVIMLTAKSETRSIFEANKMRAVDYVIKPFNQDELLRIIRRHI